MQGSYPWDPGTNPEEKPVHTGVNAISKDLSTYQFIRRKGFGYSPRLHSSKLHDGRRKIVLPKVMERPEGTSFLGVLDTKVPTYIGTEFKPIQVCFDSGSGITLISAKIYAEMTDPPKLKQGRKIHLQGVGGTQNIDQFIKVPLTIVSDQDIVVELNVEAYVTQGMNSSFILGNDFSCQFLLSLIRDKEGSRVKLGQSNQTIKVVESKTTPRIDDAGNVFQVDVQEIEATSKRRSRRRKKSDCSLPEETASVRLSHDITLKPETMLKVNVDCPFEQEEKEAFIEKVMSIHMEDRNVWGITDAILSPKTPCMHIINFSKKFIKVPKGTLLGYKHSIKALTAKSDLEEQEVALAEAKASFIQAMDKISPLTPLTPEEEKLSIPVDGGPKTSELPDYEHLPKERLLEEVKFAETLTKEQRILIEQVVLKNYQAFGLDGRLGNYPANVEINLREGTKEISLAPYTASPAKREVIDKQIDEWLRIEVIRPSKSPWGFPVLIVWRNGKPRLCIDYRKLNAVAIPDEHPLPNQTDIHHSLVRANIISSFDALAGFTQLNILEEHKHLTAFRSHRGLFEFNRLPFGFRNGPAVFQRVMQSVLAPFLWIYALVYIDDIVVFSKTFKEHLIHLDNVLKAITASGITLSPPKCFLGFESLLLLGQKVSRLGLSTHKEKVDAIVQLEVPKNVPTLQTFLGMMTYFSSYIPFYAWVAAPLFTLLKKDKAWNWGALEQEAFKLCKKALVSAPVMAYLILNKPFRLYTDACDYGIAAILQQIQDIKIADLKDTKVYERLHKAFKAEEEVPDLVIAIGNSKLKDSVAGGAKRVTWAEKFEDTVVQVERVIAYWSRILKPAEHNYSATEREALALKEGLVKFQPYLEGVEFDAITDHAALTWSSTFQNVNRRLLSWGTVFAAYPGMKIIHRAGRVHSNVDPISRLRRRIPKYDSPFSDPTIPLTMSSPDTPVKELYKELGEEFEAKVLAVAAVYARRNLKTRNPRAQQVIGIKTDTQGFINLETSLSHNLTISIDSSETSKFLSAYELDEHFLEVLIAIRKDKGSLNPPYPQYQVGDNGLLYFTDWNDNLRLCIPKSLQAEIIVEIHDSPVEAAHLGYHKTYNAIASKYYWPHMGKTIKQYVLTCDTCQKSKPKRHSPRGFLTPIPIPDHPGRIWSFDFIMDLPISNDYNAILVIVDKLTKYAHFIPCKTTINEEETAQLFFDYIVSHYGLPEQIISDRDARWTGTFWEDVCARMGIKRALTTAYHPQADGQTEVMNQILEIALRAYVSPSLDDWSQYLSSFTLAYNSSVHSSTGFSPAYLMRGFEPLRSSDLLAGTAKSLMRPTVKSEKAEDFDQAIRAHRIQAHDALKVSQAAQQKYYNARHSFEQFEEGDKVLINPHSLRLLKDQGKGRKLLLKYDGPFEVQQKVSDVAYRLRLPASYKIHLVINIEHLERYHEDKNLSERPKKHLNRQNFDELPEWEVERIIGEKWFKVRQRRIKKYLTRFMGFSAEWDKYLTKQQLRNAPEVLLEWESGPKDQ